MERRQANVYDSFLLMYVLSGTIKIQTEKCSAQADEGDIVLLDCYEKHSYQAVTPAEFVYIHFDGNNSRAFYEEIMRTKNILFRDACFCTHKDFLLSLCAEIDSGKMPAEGEISVLIHRILCDLCKNSVAEYSFRYTQFIREALAFIENNFTADISIADVARACNISSQHLNRLFRKEMETSPYQCILNKRMDYACDLLRHSDLTIEETSYKIGYSNPFNFMNAFKKKFNQTPSEFRKNRNL